MSNVNRLSPNGIDGKALEPSHYVSAENVPGGVLPSESAQTFLASADERFSVGVWECSPCREEIKSYPADEYCLVLEGTVEITADGKTQVFKAGDSFSIRRGTHLVWNMTTQFKKYFALYI
ncbi:cupin domain-containing protein [Pseudomonas sp. LABIM340]|uniref:cupin domain-containing protein n=1 Tax=Pseudomonas sp. LABIM340 TaxID=3156585 RepID=UPI0032AF3B77